MISSKQAILILTILAAACSSKAADHGSTAQPASGGAPQAAMAPAAAHGGASSQAQGGAQSVTGTVVETMNASNYTYVRVKTDSGDVWAATTEFPVKVGDRVTVPLESPMENFHSQSLNRDFPLIYFASAITREGEAPAGQGANPHAAAPAATTVTEPIAPPQGGMTIAQVWADRAKLGGKKVTVRGKVVKYNPGIMDRNWIHIQDGSGKASDGTNDLTLTTNDPTALGQVVTATGTVALDKDFGAGYSYKVILENATIGK